MSCSSASAPHFLLTATVRGLASTLMTQPLELPQLRGCSPLAQRTRSRRSFSGSGTVHRARRCRVIRWSRSSSA